VAHIYPIHDVYQGSVTLRNSFHVVLFLSVRRTKFFLGTLSAFSQTLIHMLLQRTEEVIDHLALIRLHLGSYRHARR
jgi:hypothetical protein